MIKSFPSNFPIERPFTTQSVRYRSSSTTDLTKQFELTEAMSN
jgi:hypothetical protein